MAGQGLLPSLPELAVFASAVFVLNATPGVDFALTVSRTLHGGARAGLAAALGINLGCVVHALAAAFGLAALLVLYPAAFAFIQWAGAAYLVWLGLGMLRQAWRGAAGDAGDAGQAVTHAKVAKPFVADLRTGLLTNVLNPKVALFFLAFLPQFVPADSPHKTLSFLLLGAWFVVQGFLFLMGLVLLASRLKKLRASPRASQLLNAVGGVLIIALAVRLLKEKPALVTLA
jgi:threonine/homoserine/homoserine lactone efflux protein